MLRFEILAADASVARVVELDVFPIRVGKLSASELLIDDPSVSRMHARIEKQKGSGHYTLVDLGSAGGTFVGEQKVMSHRLEGNATLQFGKVKVRMTMLEQPERQESSPVPSVPKVSVPKASVVAAKPVAAAPAFGSAPAAAGGFFAGQQQPQVIRKRKKAVSYERRFLSQRCKTGNGILEVALLWRGDVISVKQYEAKAGKTILMGVNYKCDYRVDDPRVGTAYPFLSCNSAGRWQLLFAPSMDGFILDDPQQGPEQVSFREARDARIQAPKEVQGLFSKDSQALLIGPQTRAKYEFGEVSVLVHFTDRVPVAPLILAQSAQSGVSGGLLASFLIHFSIFVLVFFATDRVDALMVDRVISTSRFAEAIVQPEEEKEQEEDKPDEIEDDTEPTDEVADDVSDQAPSPFASDKPSDTRTLTRAESVAAAQQTGLLAQSNVMNSMLSAGMAAQDFDALDWSSFDSNAAAANAGYGINMLGPGGGGSSMGGFNVGGFGPNGPGGPGGAAIRTVAEKRPVDLGSRGPVKPVMKALNPDVTGSLDRRVVQRVVRQNSGELRACYEREVAKVKGLSGRIDVTWIIAVNGSVTNAYITNSTMKNKNVEACIVRAIKNWRFPAPKGGGMAQINYPFDFTIGGG